MKPDVEFERLGGIEEEGEGGGFLGHSIIFC
jgi:hypothetical protein